MINPNGAIHVLPHNRNAHKVEAALVEIGDKAPRLDSAFWLRRPYRGGSPVPAARRRAVAEVRRPRGLSESSSARITSLFKMPKSCLTV